MKKKICPFFLQNKCKWGDGCKNLHQLPGNNLNPNQNPHFSYQNNPKDNTCKFFLAGNCTKKNCNYFHGYGNKLLNLTTYVNAHEMPIKCFAQINENKFISCDESSFKIWGFNPGFEKLKEEKIPEGKIDNLLYSNGKIFIINSITKMLKALYQILIISDQNSNFSINTIQTQNKINDIIEVENYLICIGIGLEIFQNNQNSFIKFKEINVDNEELTYIKLIQNLFFIGHLNGKISVWESNPNEFLHCKYSSNDYHNGKITKMLLKSVNSNSNYLITSSLDKNVCVINLDSNMQMIIKKQFESEVKDMYNNIDFEGNDNFFIVLGNGKIIVLNDSFNQIYEINSRANSIDRKCVCLNNPQKKENIGNFLIISDGTNIDVNLWIKENSFHVIKNNHHNFDNNNRGRAGVPFRGRPNNNPYPY